MYSAMKLSATFRTAFLTGLLALAGTAQAQVYWSGGSDDSASVLHGNALRFTDATELSDSATGHTPGQTPEPASLAVMGLGLLASSFLRRKKVVRHPDRR